MSAGNSKMVIKASKKSRATLRKKGQIKVIVKVRFEALAGGPILTREKILTIVKK
jgi:hypothetical protein